MRMCSQQFIQTFLKKHSRFKALKDFVPIFEFMHDSKLNSPELEDLVKLLSLFSIPVKEVDGVPFIKATISENGKKSFVEKVTAFGVFEILDQSMDNQFYSFDGRNLHTYGDLRIPGSDHFYLYKDSSLDSYFIKKGLPLHNTVDGYKLVNKSIGI
jgi:hypothetical protein